MCIKDALKAASSGAAFLFFLTACTTATPAFSSHEAIKAWAARQGFTSFQTRDFRLAAFTRGNPSASPSTTLTVYIEGDGAAWNTPYHPPADPTPRTPVALLLAAADPSQKVAYLGRPCQYLDAESLKNCDPAYWTDRRFAPEVIASYEQALDQLKVSLDASRIRLVGYSGGGVIATLLAARRNDVDLLITVASPLALPEWTQWHAATPLTGSLNPDELDSSAHLPPNIHFAGGKDKIVPPVLIEKFSLRHGGHMKTLPDFDHVCCWQRDWIELLGYASAQREAQ